MERYRLKNIILLILVLVNVFLLASLASRRVQEASAREEALRQLETLFAQSNLALETASIPQDAPAAVLSLSRDRAQDKKLAAFLLGDGVRAASKGGGIFRYESELGAVVFPLGGDFEAVLSVPAEDPEALCQRFCRRFGYRELALDLTDGTGTATALQYFDGHPVVNASVTLTFSGGVLQTVSGRHLPDSASAAERQDCLTALTALTAFLQYRADSGAVCNAVTAVELGYELQSTPAVPLSLTPVWRITTDTFSFYVNCVTGEVSQK